MVTEDGAELIDCPVMPPIGVPSRGAPRATTVHVPRSATLLAFTDGAVERRGEVVDTGLERLRGAAAATGGQPLEPMLDGLLETLTADGSKDDTVILGLRWTR